MSIEEMEGIRNSYFEISTPFREESRDCLIIYFMDFCINQHKDHIDKIARLEKQLAELIKQNENENYK